LKINYLAGIYIHIPFCRKKCIYCDFYKETNTEQLDGFVDVLLKEIELRYHYLEGASVSTIYLGGGTPSLLNNNQLAQIFKKLSKFFTIDSDCEITLEANPDDLTEDYLASVFDSAINRLSIGIQSFNDDHLKFLNRRHSAGQAIIAVENARKAGFRNISIDLIYGIPGQSTEDWQMQLKTAFSLNPEHISAYGLTFEPGTILFSMKQKSKVTEQNDESMILLYSILSEKIRNHGYEAYELSNFCKPGFRSRHNSSYWKFIPYLGLGPSAHSFDGNSRQWNIASIQKYIDGVATNGAFYEREELTIENLYNEYVMVSLRTMDGVDLQLLNQKFGSDYHHYFLKNMHHFSKMGLLLMENDHVKLTESGIHLSNMIITELMMAK
jgi:oxygen-independent coproporphyrinogen III oxidase